MTKNWINIRLSCCYCFAWHFVQLCYYFYLVDVNVCRVDSNIQRLMIDFAIDSRVDVLCKLLIVEFVLTRLHRTHIRLLIDCFVFIYYRRSIEFSFVRLFVAVFCSFSSWFSSNASQMSLVDSLKQNRFFFFTILFSMTIEVMLNNVEKMNFWTFFF